MAAMFIPGLNVLGTIAVGAGLGGAGAALKGDNILAGAAMGGLSAAMVVSSAHKPFGFGSEVAAELMERAFFHLDAPVMRVTPPFTPQPFGKGFEKFLHPDADRIVAAARDLMR
jgi:pyruvate dehydrogenase E1 component beta subunit